jgi:hypothetical protein
VRKVEVGQHYKETGAPFTIWDVGEETSGPGGIRHLRIHKLYDPTTIKLISEQTLADAKLYRLIERS